MLRSSASPRQMLNKVPEVTVYFWVIKVLCTTVGETVADFLDSDVGLGLVATTAIMAAFLLITLYFQFRGLRYMPVVYWLAVVLISIVGTQITDNLVDNLGVPLEVTTVIFALALAVTFATWYAIEKTLSVHTIVTTRREAFYWLAILCTFALGTSGGDLVAEQFDLGYLLSVGIFAGLIALVAFARFSLRLNPVLAFWMAYILTRPLGASLGDYLSSPSDEGGLGLGSGPTSALFLITILVTVIYLAVTKKDVTAPEAIQ